MEIESFTMNTKEARRAFLEYRREIRSRYGSVAAASAADATTMRAYRELAKGRQVLDIRIMMREAGLLDTGMPVLAICRADAAWCRCIVDHDGAALFRDEGNRVSWSGELRARETKGDVALPVGTFDVGDRFRGCQRGRAMVPEIPIAFRPHRGIANYHILWEATWEPEPPADPLLLRHLGSGLFAVLAQWDLSPIEQAVLRGLRTTPRA